MAWRNQEERAKRRERYERESKLDRKRRREREKYRTLFVNGRDNLEHVAPQVLDRLRRKNDDRNALRSL